MVEGVNEVEAYFMANSSAFNISGIVILKKAMN